MTTLYKHQIFCLHGLSGNTTADTVPADTDVFVDGAVLADVTIAVGSQITISDGVDTTDILTIIAIDTGLGVLTLNAAVGFAFPASSIVSRTPHFAWLWSESEDQLVLCPEDPTHPTQPGSAITVQTIAPSQTVIVQSTANLTHPGADGYRLSLAAGTTGTIQFSWPYVVTARSIFGLFEAANLGDNYDVEAGPNTPAGFLALPAGAGSTVLSVTGTVLSAARPSLLVRLNEGATTNTLGRIISVDPDAGTITVTTATVNAFTAAAVVLLTNANTLAMPAPLSTQPISVGGDQVLGLNVPANTIIRITYRNVGPGPSSTLVIFKYLT